MIQFVTVIHFVVCLFLILAVLLQQGKKDGMGAAFGGGSSSVFGARGAETFLEKLTKILAIIFMSTSLALVYFSSRESTGSLLSNEKSATESPVQAGQPTQETQTQTAPLTNEASPQASESAPSKEAPLK